MSQNPGDIPTIRTVEETATPSSFADERFPPGTLLAGRYRMVGRLGKGGMGEVYRADDLKLGQSVALKFLSESLVADPAALRRLHDEVRIARDISHPNICRVYDIVEADGHHFISMEFVDGEDLDSLLKRIGRFPTDKAVQVSRQLCAGLAAAHDKGILHRDLKPANVMIDGRGRVRLTDFGIAALADEMEGRSMQAGTPAYMAPEQLAGREVSERSDIYSLGLILYEVFTGKEAFHAESIAQMQSLRETGPTTPSSIVADLDPAAEQVILRCLRLDPLERPSSALAVSAALPGGDPLAEALAAGETPSPQLIAESGERGGLAPAVAVPCMVLLVLAVATCVAVDSSYGLLARTPFERPPAVLVDRAEQVIGDAGYRDGIADRSTQLGRNYAYLAWLEGEDDSRTRWDALESGRPPVIWLRHRTSPETLTPWGRDRRTTWSNPPFTEPGMTRVAVDTEGRLVHFEAVPPGGVPGAAQPVDWAPLFAAADIDPASLRSVEPAWTPDVYCDTLAAWTGPWPGANGVELRIEAGAVAGKPVVFRLIGPWEEPVPSDEADPSEWLMVTMIIGIFVLVPGAAAFLAWRHLRAGRGDRRGATRLALYVFCVWMLLWLFDADHGPGFNELFMLTMAFARAAANAVVCWFIYLALEPYARRHWPWSLVSWQRLLQGRFRDPLVGRDVLVGCLASVTVGVLSGIVIALDRPTSAEFAFDVGLTPALGTRWVVAGLFDAQTAIGIFLGAYVLLLLARIMLRHAWLANTAFVVFLTVLFSNGFTVSPALVGFAVLLAVIFLVTMTRFGLLAFAVMPIVGSMLNLFPATLDFSRWYAALGLTGPLIVIALGGYGFWIALAGRPIFGDKLLEPAAIGHR